MCLKDFEPVKKKIVWLWEHVKGTFCKVWMFVNTIKYNYFSLTRKKGSANIIFKAENWKSLQALAPIFTSTPALHTHSHKDYRIQHTHTDTHKHSDRVDSEGNSEVFVLRVLRRDEASAGIYDPRIPFICSTSGASIATAGTHPSTAGKHVYTTYPQCTPAAARSTPQWIPRWPARCHQAALWRWCDESSQLAPRKRKSNNKWNWAELLQTL